MTLPMFSIRRMMLLVAVVAGSIVAGQWSWGLFDLRKDLLAEAARHEAEIVSEARNLSTFEGARRAGKADLADPKFLTFERSVRLRIAHHEAMASKYRGAASRPWRRIPPDPPDPGVKLMIAFFLGEEIRGQESYHDQLRDYANELDAYATQLEAYATRLKRHSELLKEGRSDGPAPAVEKARGPKPPELIVPPAPIPPIGPTPMGFGESMMIELTPEAFPGVEVELKRPSAPRPRVGK